MKLTKIGLNIVRNMRSVRHRIMHELGISRVTLISWCQKEDDNLTKAIVIKIITEETGLSYDQIVTEETVTA